MESAPSAVRNAAVRQGEGERLPAAVRYQPATAAVAARVVAAFEQAVRMPDDRAGVAHGFVVRLQQLDLVAESAQRVDRGRGKARLELERVAGLAPGAAEQPARRIDRGLRIQPNTAMRENTALCDCGWPSPPMFP